MRLAFDNVGKNILLQKKMLKSFIRRSILVCLVKFEFGDVQIVKRVFKSQTSTRLHYKLPAGESIK